MRRRDRLDLVVENDALDDIAVMVAVNHMGDIGHWNNYEAPGVGGQCGLDSLFNGKEWQHGRCKPDRRDADPLRSDVGDRYETVDSVRGIAPWASADRTRGAV